MNIVITGAGGFLGQHLINYLNKTLSKDFSIFSLGNKKVPNCKNYNIVEMTHHIWILSICDYILSSKF